MIYITGDTHRDFSRIKWFCQKHHTSVDDIMIILGDAGINYLGDYRDEYFKKSLMKLPITLFCVHGNHERRPNMELGYELTEFHGDLAYIQKDYPNVVFARDGAVYDFAGHKCLVCGGAYSVDKYYRLGNGHLWFSDEQPDDKTKARVEAKLASLNHNVDVILSHTCPLKYIPTEMFLSGIDQSTVDTSTEEWLDHIEDNTHYHKWYCGHYHTDKVIDKMRFLFEDIIAISPDDQESKLAESEAKSIA